VRLAPDDTTLVAEGAKVYAAHCAACHGSKLEGQANWRERDASGRLPAPPHDPSGHTWHHADAQLFAIVKHGVAKAAGMPDYASNMPPYDGTLSDRQIVAALSWIKAQWPADIRARHDQINERAAAQKR
jgi:mono/diheme cytochrome c family protein